MITTNYDGCRKLAIGTIATMHNIFTNEDKVVPDIFLLQLHWERAHKVSANSVIHKNLNTIHLDICWLCVDCFAADRANKP